MLWRMLTARLAPHRATIVLVLGLQLASTITTLYLPNLNGDIIDEGVARGDTGYIWRIGSLMLVISLVQVVFAVAAVRAGSRAAMGFGRDVRSHLFHRVTEF